MKDGDQNYFQTAGQTNVGSTLGTDKGQNPKYLKKVCHKIFYSYFLHDSNPSRPLINRLKYFQIQF